jgi:flagellar biogenesis protein FliO
MSLRAVLSFAAVLGILAVALWALRRGTLPMGLGARRAPIVVETATSLGDRRSLAIVAVEGRRLLIGLTPSTVSFLADLHAGGEPQVPSAPGERS